jgi:hypothetical protein
MNLSASSKRKFKKGDLVRLTRSYMYRRKGDVFRIESVNDSVARADDWLEYLLRDLELLEDDEGNRALLPDQVNNPSHYTDGGIETIDFIEAKKLNYHLGQVVKYVSRAGKKADRLVDLRKAQWYLNREVKRSEKLQS